MWTPVTNSAVENTKDWVEIGVYPGSDEPTYRLKFSHVLDLGVYPAWGDNV
jgi:hypothetical protein